MCFLCHFHGFRVSSSTEPTANATCELMCESFYFQLNDAGMSVGLGTLHVGDEFLLLVTVSEEATDSFSYARSNSH